MMFIRAYGLSFLLGVSIGISGVWVFLNWNQYYSAFVGWLSSWQTLVGAFLAATVPLVVIFIDKWIKDREKVRNHLLELERYIVSCLNNLIGLDQALHRFIDVQLGTYLKRVEDDDKNDRYSVGQVFVPLLSVFSIPDSILKESTGSAYLDTLIVDLAVASKDFPLIIQDIGRQFDRTILLNKELGLAKLNGRAAHNHTLKENVHDFKTYIEEDMFQANIPRYAKKLFSVRVALGARIEWGLPKWKRTFGHGTFTADKGQEMDAFFSTKVKKQIEEYQPEFKSRLS